MKNNNYIVIQGWMINSLGLTNMNEVSVYAIIYGFSQDGNTKYTGTIKYLQECTLIKSDKTIREILNCLVEKKLLIKTKNNINGILSNHYSINFEIIPINHENKSTVNITDTCGKNYHQPAVKITDNNTNNIYKEEKKEKDNKEHYNDTLLMNLTTIIKYYNKGYSSRYGKDKYQLPIENLNGYRTIADNLKKAMVNYKIEDLQLLIDYKWINGKENDTLQSWLHNKYLDTYMDRAYQWLRDGKPEAKTTNMVFDYSGFDDETVIVIKQWFIHRKNMKKSYKTQAGLNGLRNNLIDIQNKLGKDGLIASIQNSMNNEWLKVFPIKKDKIIDSGLFAQSKEGLKFNFEGFGEKSKIKIQQWLDYRNSKKPYQTQIELDVLRDKLLALYAKSTKNVLCVSRSIDFSIGKGYNDVYEPYWTKEELADMDSMTFDEMF